jgi:alcohol dehydrogenase (NADP+)
MKTFTLNDGRTIPALGLGTWKSRDDECYRAVAEALRVGYRHIDGAWIYENEDQVGRAFREAFAAGTVAREDVFYTSKLWNCFHDPEEVEGALRQTLEATGLAYVDLYLMHWPIAFRSGVTFPRDDDGFWPLSELPLAKTFEAMLRLRDRGLVRSVGVSNFSASKLRALAEATGVTPTVNQVELHPHHPQAELVEHCAAAGVHLTAYSPLASPDRPASMKHEGEPPLLESDAVTRAAEAAGMTPGQVLIAWAIDRGTSVIPKSANPARIAENLAAAQRPLPPEARAILDGIGSTFRYIDPKGMFREGVTHEGSDFWA